MREYFLGGVNRLFNAFNKPKIDIEGFDCRSVTEDVVKGYLNFYHHKKPRVFILENRIPLKVTQRFIESIYIEVLVKNKIIQGIKPLEISGNPVLFSVEDFMSIYHPVKCICGVVSVPMSNHYPEKCVCGRLIDIDDWNEIKLLTLSEVNDFIIGEQ